MRRKDETTPEPGRGQKLRALDELWSTAYRIAFSVPASPEQRSEAMDRHALQELAARGERDLVRQLAEFEPRAVIRATAILLLIRPMDALSREVFLRTLRAEADASVLIEVLRGTPVVGGDAELDRAAEALLHRQEPELRSTVLERQVAASADPTSLVRALSLESPRVRGRVLDGWIATAGPRAVLCALAQAPHSLVVDALVRVPRGAVSFEALAPFAERGVPSVDAVLVPLLDERMDASAAPLSIRVLARSIDPESRALADHEFSRDLVERALSSLERVLPRLSHAILEGLHALAVQVEQTPRDERDVVTHRIAALTGSIRMRLGTCGPFGFVGSTSGGAGPARTVVDHTRPDGTSTVVVWTDDGFELRAPLDQVEDVFASVPDARFSELLKRMSNAESTAVIDAEEFADASARSLLHLPAGRDLATLALHAAVGRGLLRVRIEQGWWDVPRECPHERPTVLE